MAWCDVIQAHTPSGQNLVRLCRAARLLRIIHVLTQVRRFTHVRLIGHMIGGAAIDVGWALFFLLLITYIFAIFCMTYLSTSLGGISELSNVDQEAVLHSVKFYYGSVQTTVRYLIASICGGVDWM